MTVVLFLSTSLHLFEAPFSHITTYFTTTESLGIIHEMEILVAVIEIDVTVGALLGTATNIYEQQESVY